MNRADLLKYASPPILDVGCGDALFLWGGEPPQEVTCIDVDVYKHTHIQANAAMLPLRNNSFNTVLLMEILEHVDDVAQVVNEAKRVGGRVIISYPNESSEDMSRLGSEWDRINDLIRFESMYGLRKALKTGQLYRKAHYHWKNRQQILNDIKQSTDLCGGTIPLDYGLYNGWGFLC